MINFIICDDQPKIRSIVKKQITIAMSKAEQESVHSLEEGYCIREYEDIDNKILQEINRFSGKKVYILDIDLPSGSGIDFARKIRENDDWESIIIFASAHYELSHDTYKKRWMILDFINKHDNFETRLFNTINRVLKIISKPQIFTFTSDKVTYRLPINEIVCIERDTVERKINIITCHQKHTVNAIFSDFTDLLDKRFIYIRRAAVINKNRVRSIDYDKEIITFDCDAAVTGIDYNKKKELKKEMEKHAAQ